LQKSDNGRRAKNFFHGLDLINFLFAQPNSIAPHGQGFSRKKKNCNCFRAQ
jgi:hypothetical protein